MVIQFKKELTLMELLPYESSIQIQLHAYKMESLMQYPLEYKYSKRMVWLLFLISMRFP